MICQKMSEDFPDESMGKQNGASNGNIKMGPNIKNQKSPSTNCSC